MYSIAVKFCTDIHVPLNSHDFDDALTVQRYHEVHICEF